MESLQTRKQIMGSESAVYYTYYYVILFNYDFQYKHILLYSYDLLS